MRDGINPQARPATPDAAWLDAAHSEWLFGEGSHHVPVGLRRIENARLLWLNQDAAQADPHFAHCGGDLARYAEHLLAACAWLIDDQPSAGGAGEQAIGHADRYGGPGIGMNGGSGRAALVNGYLVKGVGRTPLVSAMTDAGHASGGAYLEESVREVIYGEIVRAEFPHSAIPALAIIDTGLVQVWNESAGPRPERRTLLVRPCFMRPAHFQRATGFYSCYPKEGMFDSLRVATMFERAGAAWGGPGLAATYEAFWLNWACQLAYSFVHRLPHGSNTISNICLDGKLLDFGATSAVPSWANAATMLAPLPFARHFEVLPAALRSNACFFGRYFDNSFAGAQWIDQLVERARLVYRETLMTQALRLCGVDREPALQAAQDWSSNGLWDTLGAVIARFQKERIDMVEATPQPRLEWDLATVWDEAPAPHLHALRALLDTLVPAGERAATRQRCARLCATRSSLFREETKRAIYRAVDPSHAGQAPDPQHIARFIAQQVAAGRRDHRLALEGASTIGFAVGAAGSWVIGRDDGNASLFAIREGCGDATRLALRRLTRDGMQFADPALAPVAAAVCLAGDDAALLERTA